DRELPGDSAAVGDLRLNGGDLDQRLIERDAQRLSNVGAGEVTEGLGAVAVELKVDFRTGAAATRARLAEANGGIGQILAADHDRLVCDRVANFGIGRAAEINPLQQPGAADGLLGQVRILDTGKLDQQVVRALLLDLRLGHAEGIDALRDDRLNRVHVVGRDSRPARRWGRLEEDGNAALEVEAAVGGDLLVDAQELDLAGAGEVDVHACSEQDYDEDDTIQSPAIDVLNSSVKGLYRATARWAASSGSEQSS